MSNTVHFFTKGGYSVPSSRYRAFMIADLINQLDTSLKAECHSPKGDPGPVAFKSISGILSEMAELTHIFRQTDNFQENNIIYCQRPVYKRLRALYLLSKRREYPLVFDFDDAIFLNRPNMTRWFLERADVVIAGNQFLEKYANWYCDRVYQVPTGIPYNSYETVNYDSSDSNNFRIGWVGNAVAHRQNLLQFADILESIPDVLDNVTVHLVGVRDTPEVKKRFDAIGAVETMYTDWIESEDYSSEIPTLITSFDIGVMPLEDSIWNCGKSAFKLLEYMACGVPAVASPVGENRHIINHGVNGYLAAHVDEWRQAIKSLYDPEHRQEISVKARRTIENKYTQQEVANKLVRIFQNEFINE